MSINAKELKNPTEDSRVLMSHSSVKQFSMKHKHGSSESYREVPGEPRKDSKCTACIYFKDLYATPCRR